MSTAIRLCEEMFKKATACAKVMNRSVAKQVEYWAKIGKIAEENEDLPYSFIKDLLMSQEEVDNSQLEAYSMIEGNGGSTQKDKINPLN
ncbi:MAG: ParD-like family protein [Cytophagales bacterium]|nr:ParD-like family protein [Cytophagales bacterium]